MRVLLILFHIPAIAEGNHCLLVHVNTLHDELKINECGILREHGGRRNNFCRKTVITEL